MLIQDDHYGGYFLPKGTILFANAWAIHMDETEYEDADEFIPDRFIHNKFGCKSSHSVSEDHRRATYAFGAGRRVCPGQRLAENSLVRSNKHQGLAMAKHTPFQLLNMAKMVWLFDIRHASPTPVDVSMSTAFSDGFLVAPKNFPVHFLPRSEQHVRVIRSELKNVREIFVRYED